MLIRIHDDIYANPEYVESTHVKYNEHTGEWVIYVNMSNRQTFTVEFDMEENAREHLQGIVTEINNSTL